MKNSHYGRNVPSRPTGTGPQKVFTDFEKKHKKKSFDVLFFRFSKNNTQ